MTVIGIDKSASSPDNVRLTITAPRVEASKKPGGEEKKEPHILTSEGSSVFEALRKFRLFTDRKIFLGHISFIIIGEDTAKKNVNRELDLLTRDHELRLNSKVLIAKGHTAEDVIRYTKGNDEYLAGQLDVLSENYGGISQSGKIELIKLMQAFDKTNAASYIPYISLHDNTSYLGLNSEDKDIYLEGFAIFKDTNLYGYIKDKESRGFNWIKNKVKSGAIVVKTKAGNIVTLEIIESKAKVIPVLENKNIRVTIKLRMSSNIDEVQGAEDIFNESTLSFLESEQSELIKSEIMSTLTYAQKANTDFLEIGSALEHKYPVKWKDIKDKWNDLFSKIAFNVEVESRINRTYIVEKPSKLEGGK